MKTKELLLDFLDGIIHQIEGFSDADIKKLESGDFSLSIKIIKKRKKENTNNELTLEEMKNLEDKLQKCREREDGKKILSFTLKNRKQLEIFAKHIDVYITKQYNVDKIKDKIIEGLIGASLGSEAILGKKSSTIHLSTEEKKEEIQKNDLK